MSYIFSRALVEEFLEANCSASEPSAPSKSNPTPQAYCSPARMTDYSRLSRFGMTYAPLTDDRGAALLTWYLEASRARTFQPLEKAPALTAPAPGSGGKCTELLARYDLNMSLWRTPQCSLLAGLDVFLETWPRSGMMRNGWCWERTTWEPRMNVSACGSLPKLPTLAKADGEGGGEVNWKPVRKSGHRAQLTLRTAVRMLPPLTCQDAKNNGTPSQAKRNSPLLNALAGGPLNPVWCEWFMGWPEGWTELKPLETDKFRQWRQLHSGFCSADSSMERRGHENHS